MSVVAAAGSPSVRGSGTSALEPQIEIDDLKQQITTLRAMVGSLVKDMEGVKAKLETAPITKIEPKPEPTESELWDSLDDPPAQREDPSDDERMEVEHEVQGRVGAYDGLRDTPQDTAGAGERIASTPPRRQSTDEPIWSTPPHGEVLFRANLDYVRRTDATNRAATNPVRDPTPPPQSREENPPPPRSPSLPPVTRPSNPIGITPASKAKRKHNFELIIEIPAKRFKPSRYPESIPFGGPTASSSRNVPANSVTRSEHSPAKKPRGVRGRRPMAGQVIRGLGGVPFQVALDPKTRDVAVTREFLMSHFGADRLKIFTEPPQGLIDKHGYDHFVFVHSHGTPQAPSAPGEPGLVTHIEGKQWPKLDLYRVFVRVVSTPARWQYMGLYKATKLPAWSPAEVRRVRDTVKGNWAATIKTTSWARPVLARIMLQSELGREPTKAEVDDRVKKLKKRTIKPAPMEVIRAALERGEGKLYPWKLECEDYEDDLQREIALTYPSYEKEAARNASVNA